MVMKVLFSNLDWRRSSWVMQCLQESIKCSSVWDRFGLAIRLLGEGVYTNYLLVPAIFE